MNKNIVTNINNQEPIHWIVWYKNLNVYDKKEVKDAIINKCFLNDVQTFKNWVYSYIPVPTLEQNIIAKIAKQPLDFTFEPRASSYHTRKLLNQ